MPRTREASRSWRVRRLGTPAEALRLEPVTPRPPGPGEVRVRVHAVGLNHPDILLCAGRYQERPPLPFSPGYEAAGVVTDAGADTGVRAGQRVVVVPELPEGSLQETLTLPASHVYPVPAAMPFDVAAVLHIAYSTAHVALHHRAGLRPGETLLVTGAAGGVGTAAVQLGRAHGARVVAAVTGARKAAACRRLGADAVLDLAEDSDLVTRVRALTEGRGADVVLDVVGGDSYEQLRRCVAFEGRLVLVGFAGGSVPATSLNHPLLRNYSIVGLNLATYRREDPRLLRDVHASLVELVSDGTVAPVVYRALPFDSAPAGLDLLVGREVVGRVVLRS